MTIRTSYPVIDGNFNVARELKNGNTALIVLGDSIWSPNTGGRICQMLPLALKIPITGIFCAAGGPISQTYNDPGGNVGNKTGGQAILAFEQFTGLNQCFRYCVDKDSVAASGGWHFALSSSSYDCQDIPDVVAVYTTGGTAPAYNATCTQGAATGKVCYDDATNKRLYIKTTSGTFSTTGTITISSPSSTRLVITSVTSLSNMGITSSTAIPVSMRRQAFTVAPGAGVAICKVRSQSATLLKGNRSYSSSTHGDFTAQNVAVNCGLVCLSSSDSPNGNCNLVTYRGGVQKNSTAINLRSSPGNVVKYTSPLDTTSTSGNVEFQLQIGSATITADTTFVNFIGATLETPNATTGTFPISIGNAGWNTNDWANPSLLDDTATGAFLSAVVGTSRTWVFVIPMLQNQTGTELSELNAGTTTTATANLIAMASRFSAIAAAQGARAMFVFVTPYEAYDSGASPTVAKTDTNMRALVESHWLAANACGGLFINQFRGSCNGVLAQAGRSNGSSLTYEERILADSISNPNIHPDGFVGSRHFATLLSAAVEQASETFTVPRARRSRR